MDEWYIYVQYATTCENNKKVIVTTKNHNIKLKINMYTH